MKRIKNVGDYKLFVILVNYNQPELTLKCIYSIRKSEAVTPFIVIVDNGSQDNSINILSEIKDAHTILLKSEQNNGFAAGNNIGIKYAINNGADFITLLNNDTEIDRSMIVKLLNNCNDKTAVSPKMYYYNTPEKIWFAGGKYLSKSGRFIHIGENELDTNQYCDKKECDFLTGCCIMLSSETIKKLGYLDEQYFMYMEDIDYSIRLKSAGIKLLMIPEAKLWHKIGSSSGGEKSKMALYYGNRNRLYLLKKYNYSLYIRILAYVSRIILFCKGILMNTNESVIGYSIIDYLQRKMGKSRRPL